MKVNKKGLIVAAFLTIVLAVIVIYSKGFEQVLYRFFSSKNEEGSRTLLAVYFFEHLWMVLLSSLIAIVLGTSIGIFITTSYGREFKELLLKTVNLGQAFPSPALLALAVPILGYGIKGALIALVIYILMPIVYLSLIHI